MEAKERPVLTSQSPRHRVYGVDFSGARDAGQRIWLARGSIEENSLEVLDLFQAESLPGSGRERGLSHRALVSFIGEQEGGIFGLDFPFSLPQDLLWGESWEEFALTFEKVYKSPEDFREGCRSAASGKESKRNTDSIARTPFSPYNLRVYRQTYFGIREILAPLIKKETICVLPMQKPLSGRTWVIEVCPASTLKKARLSVPYKGKDERKKTARKTILKGLEKTGVLAVKKSVLRSIIVEDRDGDALDSVIAALAAFRALQIGLSCADYTRCALEGWVYA